MATYIWQSNVISDDNLLYHSDAKPEFFMLQVSIKVQGLKDSAPSGNVLPTAASVSNICVGYISLTLDCNL